MHANANAPMDKSMHAAQLGCQEHRAGAYLCRDDVDADVLEGVHNICEQAGAVARADGHLAVRPRLLLTHLHARLDLGPASRLTPIHHRRC